MITKHGHRPRSRNLQRGLKPHGRAEPGPDQEHFKSLGRITADKIGKSRPAVTNCLRLLKLPDSVQTMLEGKILSAGHARALLGIEDPKAMEFLAGMVQTKELTVQAAEELVKKFKNLELRLWTKGSTLPLDIRV